MEKKSYIFVFCFLSFNHFKSAQNGNRILLTQQTFIGCINWFVVSWRRFLLF